MDAPVRLVVKIEEGIDGPVTLLRNGRPVADGTWEYVHARMKPLGLAPGGEFTVVVPTANIHMRLLTPEERASGASPIVAIKPRRQQQSNGAAA